MKVAVNPRGVLLNRVLFRYANYKDVHDHQRRVVEDYCCGKEWKGFLSLDANWVGKKA